MVGCVVDNSPRCCLCNKFGKSDAGSGCHPRIIINAEVNRVIGGRSIFDASNWAGSTFQFAGRMSAMADALRVAARRRQTPKSMMFGVGNRRYPRPAGRQPGCMPLGLLPPFVLPVSGDIRAGFCKVHMLVNVVDPGDRDEVMMVAIRGTLFGQLDLVGALQMVDLADGLFVG